MRAGHPVRVMLAQRLSEADEILAKLGGSCAAEYKYDGMRVQAHRTADGEIELFTRRQERVSAQFPDVVELLQPDCVRARRSSRARSSPTIPRPTSCGRSARSCTAAGSTASPRRRATCRSGCSASSCCTPTARTSPMLPYPERRAALAEALTLSDRLRLTTASRSPSRRRWTPSSSRRSPTAAEGLVCKATGPGVGLPGRRPRLVLDQAEAGLPHRAGRHRRSGGGRRVRRARAAARQLRRGAAGGVRPGDRAVPDGRPLRRRLLRRRSGRAAGAAGAADPPGATAPGRLPGARRPLVRAGGGDRGAERRAHRLAEPHGRLGRSSSPTAAWPCGSRASPGAGATTRSPRTPPPPRSWSSCSAPPADCRSRTADAEISVASTPGRNLRLRRLRPLDAGCNLRRVVDAYVNVGFDHPEVGEGMMGRCPKATASTRRPASSTRR